MAHRTTLLLDEDSRQAARQLALRYDCSTSEAIRRAVVHQRDLVLGASVRSRRKTLDAMERLFELFEGHDAASEVRRLKLEDEGF